jgi:hypothetical protein
MAEGTTTGLIARAQAFGLRLEYRSGFLIVTRPASADRRREDLVEMEQATIEQLGKRLAEARAQVIAAARAARGKELIGQRVFIPLVGIGDRRTRDDREGRQVLSQISGKLVACSEEGTLTVSHVERYGVVGHHRGSVERTATCNCDEAFVVVDGGDQPDRASSFASIRSDKIRGAMERGRSIGLTLELDAGFAVAKWNVAPEDQDSGEEILRELGRPRGELLGVLEGRASDAAGSAFVGQRVFIRPFDSFGLLQSCHPGGHLDVTYEDKHLGRLTCSCSVADLLIVLDAEEAGRSASPQSSPAPKNWLRRTFGD